MKLKGIWPTPQAMVELVSDDGKGGYIIPADLATPAFLAALAKSLDGPKGETA